MDFKDKVALITGGSSGIGLGIARSFAKEGAQLVLTGMNPQKAEDAAKAVADEFGVKTLGISCDVTDRTAMESLSGRIEQEFGPVDILVNNAGVGYPGLLHQHKDEDWDWVMDVNVRSVFLHCRHYINKARAAGRPLYIVQTGSEQSLGLTPLGSMHAYTASKHALLGLSDAIRRDYADDEISISIVCPGIVNTEIWNADRNRQAGYGEKEERPPEFAKMMEEMGMDPDLVGDMTVKGMKDGKFFIITHQHIREIVETRNDELQDALTVTDSWFD
jgi:NAD(P)-dependent dehydrogenase (short-subunit alcohol dehydrogenase family)